MIKMNHNHQQGFTIVELMIATAVLSVVLLLATVMITSIGTLYYKGVNQARIQNDARSITDEISQNLKLSKGIIEFSPPSGPRSYCINSVRYTYIVGTQIGNGAGQSPHVLWRDQADAACTPVNLNVTPPSANGTELISPRSRLVKLSISGTPNTPYKIDIGIAYGDSDLLCSPSAPGTCNGGAAMPAAAYQNGDLICKGGAGRQFCATTTLTTTVLQRITGD